MFAMKEPSISMMTTTNLLRANCLVFSLAVLTPAFALVELAQAKNCLACHAVNKKVIGPAFKDVAAKYAGQPGIVDKLAAKVINGGGGVWGVIPMPANSQVSEADAKQLVTWILTLK